MRLAAVFRPRPAVRVALLATLLVTGGQAVLAQHDYSGSGSGGGVGEEGFVFYFQGVLTNPRNVDNVVAADNGPVFGQIIPGWDNEVALRAGLAWEWSGGRVGLTSWGYETEADFGSTGSFAFPIGPAVSAGSGYIGDTGNAFVMRTDVEASTLDVYYARPHALSDSFTMEWSGGVRYARYEETSAGTYSDGLFLYGANKTGEGEMFGIRLGVKGDFHFKKAFSIGGGLAFSALDGELTASSSLVPSPASFPPGVAVQNDEGRSGSIRDLDVNFGWEAVEDLLIVRFGWEQSTWEGLTSDLMRNLPGVGLTLRTRDSVVFSGYSVGVELRF